MQLYVYLYLHAVLSPLYTLVIIIANSPLISGYNIYSYCKYTDGNEKNKKKLQLKTAQVN